MKDVRHLPAVRQDAAVACRSSLKKWVGIMCMLVCLGQGINAQCTLPPALFSDKEEINYEVYFKWGILMPKAGMAQAKMYKSTYNNEPAWKYRLLAHSSGMIDKFFSVHDTIDTFFSYTRPTVLFSEKRTLEGGYYQLDRLTIKTKDNRPAVHSFRRSTHLIKIDSLMYGDHCILDMLGALTFIRTIDWSKMNINDEVTSNVVMGRDMIKVNYRYRGQQVLERGGAKYKTRLFVLDVYDESFTQSKESVEVWIGDDENHVPIKIRAKLKIGAAEAYYHSSAHLKHPFTCRVVIPK